MSRPFARFVRSIPFLLLLAASHVRAQWMPDGVALSAAAGQQFLPMIVSDGAGGAIVTWQDYRGASPPDIYVQRVNASGVPLWTTDGVALCTAANFQEAPVIISDGAGGAIVAWHDYRPSATADIYVRRVNASGVPQWTADGVALCTAMNTQANPAIVSDGSGGAIVAWSDSRSGTSDVYVRRVNASGVPQWTADGVALCIAANAQTSVEIVSDESGGAIVTWRDFRTGSTSDIYARLVNFLGSPSWTSDGVALCTATGDQSEPTIVPDGSAGAIVAWEDFRGGASSDIYARRVNAAGVAQWATNGVALCQATGSQYDPVIDSDGSGGAIVAWQDYRPGATSDIYARRVNASGVAQWTADGVTLCTAVGVQYPPAIASDGSGGAIVTWYDYRSSVTLDIYARRVSASGVAQWTADGVTLCTAAGDQEVPAIIVDGSGGAIVAWQDSRTGASDVYVQRLEDRHGYWGHPEPRITSVADVPGDQGGKVKVNWTASDWDILHLQTITHYSVWRATDAIVAGISTASEHLLDPSAVGEDFRGPAVRVERSPAGEFYWEWIGNQSAQYFAGYRFSASTSADSTSQGEARHYFQVLSHTSDPFVFWSSNVDSGYSVDNLAPAAPLQLTAQRIGVDVRLRWNSVTVPDLRDYSVYRAGASGLTPIPPNFLSSAEDTVLIDANAPTTALYYIVTANDIHDNQSAPSNEASVSATTNVGKSPPIDGLTVLSNHPNPFTASTAFEVGLSREANIEIEVFDVSGRRVREQMLASQRTGWRTVRFDGRDDRGRPLVSGVYFYRVTAAGRTITRKIVVAR